MINFATEKRGNIHGKAWILPRLSVFFSFCGNNSVTIETTPNLRYKSDNVLYLVRCLSRRYIHAWPSLYPRLAVAASTLCIRFFLFLNANPGIRCRYIHALLSLYPCLAVSVSMPGRRCIHALYKFKKKCKPQE